MKLHEILISASFVTVVFVGFVLLYTNGSQVYGSVGADYGNASGINESLNEINEIGQDTREIMQGLQGLPLGLDILGSMVIGAYGAMKTTGVSFSILFGIFDSSNSYLELGEFGNTLIIFAGTSLLIIIFIAIFMHYVSQSERI